MDYIDQLYKSYYPELTLPLLMIAGILAVLTYLCAFGLFRTLRMPRAKLRACVFGSYRSAAAPASQRAV